MTYKSEAHSSRSAKLRSMGTQDRAQFTRMARDGVGTKVDPSVTPGPRGSAGGGQVPLGKEMRKPEAYEKSTPRLDKRARGGRVKKPQTTINIVIAGKGGRDDKPPMPMPVPIPAGGTPMPPRPPMPAPGAAPMPIARKYGGRIPHLGEAKGRTEKMRAMMSNQKGFASGGRVHTFPKIDDGAGSGPGRLEKVEKYGKRARP